MLYLDDLVIHPKIDSFRSLDHHHVLSGLERDGRLSRRRGDEQVVGDGEGLEPDSLAGEGVHGGGGGGGRGGRAGGGRGVERRLGGLVQLGQVQGAGPGLEWGTGARRGGGRRL